MKACAAATFLSLALLSPLALGQRGFGGRDVGPAVDVVFNSDIRPNLSGFSLFDEGENFNAKIRPSLALVDGGLAAKPGEGNGGNYTAWKFATVDNEHWELRATFTIPATAKYSNSGIFFLMQDPNDAHGVQAIEAKEKAEARRKTIGQAPTELEFFGYELQIIAGEANHELPAQNQGAGAFYGVPLSRDENHIVPGEQFIHAPYALAIGESYELIVRAERELGRLTIRTFFKTLKLPTKLHHVATFVVPSVIEHSARGGMVPQLYLQAFINKGDTSLMPVFRDIRILLSH